MIAELFDLLWFLAKSGGFSLLLVFMLWVFFLAVMKLKDIRNAGRLVGPVKGPAYLVLLIGYLLDALCNLLVLTALLLELPRLKGGAHWYKESEWTVSARTKRWALTATWRGAFCRWLRTSFLAAADVGGGHD